jgi:hypothetical protein
MLDSCRAESLGVQVSEIPTATWNSGSHGQRKPDSPNQALPCHEADLILLPYIDDRYIDKRLYRGATEPGNSFLYPS